MRTVRANQGETLDQICYRTFGSTAEVTERALRLNPGLAELGPVLPEGTLILLPETEPTTRRIDTVQLWT
ncbi:tail protein X [Halomonas cupida]|uniref:Tail protein X n=1 Tax=Halomonas cupida TaxID=44933 RepID=A0A1M7KHH6_9GAMM|nr:tail protein X [Halomonas cupida]GEN25388.1 tail protein X [Halomonas cupida]SHM64755.1 P2-like prophage tail protein X [Halomonas cupida]